MSQIMKRARNQIVASEDSEFVGFEDQERINDVIDYLLENDIDNIILISNYKFFWLNPWERFDQ